MSGNAKSPAEGLKDSECERGAITTRPPIPYVAPVDSYEKQEKTEIKTKLPDGTTSVNPIFDLAKLIFVEKFLVDLAIK